MNNLKVIKISNAIRSASPFSRIVAHSHIQIYITHIQNVYNYGETTRKQKQHKNNNDRINKKRCMSTTPRINNAGLSVSP